MATLLRNKLPVPPLPKEPPLPDQPPEPPLDEIARGLNRLVATRHKRLDRATKHPPLERAIKQAGALQHARKQEHMQQEQVKTQRQAVQAQRAQATADSLGTVAEAAKKSASKPTGPLARPQPAGSPVTAPPVQSHAKPQQEAPAPSYGFEKRKQTPEDEQTAGNIYHEMMHAANNPELSEEARQDFRAKAERHKAAVFGSRPVPKYKEPKLPKAPAADTVERGPAEPKPPRKPKASTLKPPVGTVLEKPATPEPPPRGFRRRPGHLMSNGPKAPPEPKTPERSAVIPDAMEPPIVPGGNTRAPKVISNEQKRAELGIPEPHGEEWRKMPPPVAPGEPEPPIPAPVRGGPTPLRGRFDTMIALLKGHKWGAFNRYTMPPQPPGVQRELQRAMNEQRNEGAEGTARRIEARKEIRAEELRRLRAAVEQERRDTEKEGK